MPLLARGPGFGIKKISVLLALVTYFSMMQYSVRSKILSEKWVFLSTFHRCFRRNFNPVYFQMVSGSVGPDSHTQQLVKGPVIRSLFNHKVEQVIHVWVRSFPEKGFQRSLFPLTQIPGYCYLLRFFISQMLVMAVLALKFIEHQGGIKWGNRGTRFLDSEGSHRQRRPQTYAVLSRNCICRDLRAFSGVIFPSFDRNSNIFAIFIEQKSYGQNRKAFDRTENLSIEQKSYRQTFLSRKRAITTFLSRKFMITRSSIA